MVEEGWLSAADRATYAELPKILDYKGNRFSAGPNGFITAAVKKELLSTGLTEQDIDKGGLRIVTTIDKKAQNAAIAAMKDNLPKKVQGGLVAVRPGDGAVVAMYGGADYAKNQFNSATTAIMQGASNFKPFAVLAAVREGISTKTKFDGDQPQEIDGTKITNFGERSYGMVDMRRMIGRSINTAFVNLNKEVTPAKTRQAAVDAGIPAKTPGMDDTLTNVLGTASPHVIDMASAYSTIASQGVRSKPYFVTKVTSTEGDFDYEVKPQTQRAFDKDVTADVTDAMTYTVKTGGTATKLQQLGRPVAGKTGTSSEAKSIWFSGFVPQLAVSVGMYKPDAKGNPQTLTDGEDTQPHRWHDPGRRVLRLHEGRAGGRRGAGLPEAAGVGDEEVPTPTPTVTQTPTHADPDADDDGHRAAVTTTTAGAADRRPSRPRPTAPASRHPPRRRPSRPSTEPAPVAHVDEARQRAVTQGGRPGRAGGLRGHRRPPRAVCRVARAPMGAHRRAAVGPHRRDGRLRHPAARPVPAHGLRRRRPVLERLLRRPAHRLPRRERQGRPRGIPAGGRRRPGDRAAAADRAGADRGREPRARRVAQIASRVVLRAVVGAADAAAARHRVARRVERAPADARPRTSRCRRWSRSRRSSRPTCSAWRWRAPDSGRGRGAARRSPACCSGSPSPPAPTPCSCCIAIGLLCLRSGRLREFARTAAYAVLTFGVVLSPLWLVNPGSRGQRLLRAGPRPGRVTARRGCCRSSPGTPCPNGAVTALAVLGWVVALLAGAVLALSSARRPTVAEVSLVMVAIVLVTGKSFTVQSSLWLVPLVAWCALQWRDHLIWAGAEALNFVAVWLTIAATTVPDRGLPAPWYAFFSMLRVVAVLWLAAVVWLRARERWGRAATVDEGMPEVDDLAGPMAGADDRVIVRFS